MQYVLFFLFFYFTMQNFNNKIGETCDYYYKCTKSHAIFPFVFQPWNWQYTCFGIFHQWPYVGGIPPSTYMASHHLLHRKLYSLSQQSAIFRLFETFFRSKLLENYVYILKMKNSKTIKKNRQIMKIKIVKTNGNWWVSVHIQLSVQFY